MTAEKFREASGAKAVIIASRPAAALSQPVELDRRARKRRLAANAVARALQIICIDGHYHATLGLALYPAAGF